MFFDIVKPIRINKEIESKAQGLLDNYGDKYDNLSHVFRCGIMELHRQHIKDRKQP